MTKLSELPQVAFTPLDTSVTYEGTEYTFRVRQVGYGTPLDPTLAEGELRQPKLLADLVSFEDDAGEYVNLSYDVAAKLPPNLGVLLLGEALRINGYGENPEKN
jgi:hypothetical protein